ncbi:hypothetical protein [Fusobacterium sp. IOR10]|uniref:hypothetical protein n=1 Tax=Fusobacterium sp. IOR10 TaxID=2665157 RepID=UPI0013D4458A|nr:hypothetical protein [Fusobacterium sp. IOR10]
MGLQDKMSDKEKRINALGKLIQSGSYNDSYLNIKIDKNGFIISVFEQKQIKKVLLENVES